MQSSEKLPPLIKYSAKIANSANNFNDVSIDNPMKKFDNDATQEMIPDIEYQKRRGSKK